jgi:hypothetical protein
MSDNLYIDKEELDKIKKKEDSKKKKPKSSNSETKSNSLAQIMNGEFLNKEFVLNNLSFIFFIMFLLLLIVGKGYYGKQISKDVDKTQKKVDELMADYVEAKAKLEEETRRYQLVDKLGAVGLSESENNTKVIRIKSNSNKE